MTDTEILESLKSYTVKPEILDKAIKVLEQEPCDDAVSRQAVLDIVNNPLNIRLVDIIKALPPVTLKEKIGHWVNNHTKCSNCKWGMEDDVVGSPMMLFFPFCPNCGARMVESCDVPDISVGEIVESEDKE